MNQKELDKVIRDGIEDSAKTLIRVCDFLQRHG